MNLARPPRTARLAGAAAVAALPFLVGACVGLEDIQQREPTRTMNFTGSYGAIAECVHRRVGGRMQYESLHGAYVIYDSVKATQYKDGISHYSITIARTDLGQGTASVRIVFTPDTPQLAQERRRRLNAGEVQISPVEKYWTPVVDCVADR